jgi:prolyl oligopeptidase
MMNPGGIAYPPTRKSDQVDVLHGVRVEDPYRWLEDLDSPETRAWIEAQNAVTQEFLEALPERAALKRRLTTLWNYERHGVPFKKGGRYFFFKNDGLQNQSVLYVQDALAAPARTLLDPNALSPDGTVALTVTAVSEDGKLLAYGLSASGSDWESWRVRRVDTGEDLPDALERIKFSAPAWLRDGSGFFYGRYNRNAGDTGNLEEVNRFQRLYFHRIGDAQEKDALVYKRDDEPDWGFGPQVSEDGRYLIITVWKGTDPRNLVFWKDLSDPEGEVRELIPEFRARFGFIDNEGTRLWFQTDLAASRGRALIIDLVDPAESQWRELLPESPDTLEGVHCTAGRLVAQYLSDAHSRVRLFSLQGAPLGEIPLPGLGTAHGLSGERDDTEMFFGFTAFTFPGTVYRHDFATGETSVFRKPSLDFDAAAFETRQVFYPSRDGTRIPMFLVHKRGLVPDGNVPTYLYGYGGFGVSLTPSFSAGNLPWLEAGGILAVANLRGGGEYGEEWHQAGAKARRQNVFDDFISAAEWLIAEGYTRPERLGIGGGSNGGLLVAACMVQRPDLFAAVMPAVGVLDMLRFHKFTIGWAWESDYGNPDNAEDFRIIRKYSPLHNLKPGTAYPAVLLTTADHDDRVVPSHSFKFAAALQAAVAAGSPGSPAGASQGPQGTAAVAATGRQGTAAGAQGPRPARPALIRIETKAGHGAGKPMTKVIEEAADRWAFLMQATRGI